VTQAVATTSYWSRFKSSQVKDKRAADRDINFAERGNYVAEHGEVKARRTGLCGAAHRKKQALTEPPPFKLSYPM
jgi:hypothetical protein